MSEYIISLRLGNNLKKISLIGAGNIGGTIASMIMSKNLANVVLIDVQQGLAKGKALDLNQSKAVTKTAISIRGTEDLEEIKNSDVIIVTAGIARRPGMSRDDLIETNFNIMENIGLSIKKNSPNAFVICVTNPLDAMVWTLYKTSGLDKKKIVGMAGILDTSRFKYFLSDELNVSSEDISTIVLGGHGDTMVPLLRFTCVNGVPIDNFVKKGIISQKKLDSIVERTRNGGGEIVGLLKNSSAYYAPAVSALEMAESFLFNQKKLLPCSTLLEGEYGYKELFVGVPIVIGESGVEKIYEIDFIESEKNNFDKSVSAVRELTQKCKKLLV